jgi:hypothetical protein
MKLMQLMLAILLTPALAGAAPIVTFTVQPMYPFGTFQITVDATRGDSNGGLAGYSFQIMPQSGMIKGLDHKSARAPFALNGDGTESGPIGFNLLRSADNNSLVTGFQDVITPTPFLIYNYGISPGNFDRAVQKPPATLFGSSEGNNWPSQPVIVSGMFSGQFPTLIELTATVFVRAGSSQTVAALAMVGPYLLDPEPASAALAGLGLLVLTTTRRTRCQRFPGYR